MDEQICLSTFYLICLRKRQGELHTHSVFIYIRGMTTMTNKLISLKENNIFDNINLFLH